MRITRTWLAGLVLLAAASGSPSRAQDVSGVMLEGWYWDSPVGAPEEWWNLLSREMPRFRDWGVTALWIPPPTKAAGGGYSSGYDLYDYYDLGSKDQCGTIPTKWGTKENLLKMISIAHGNGLDVYADIVVNHRAGGEDGGYRYDKLVGSEATGRFTMADWDFHHNGQGDWDMDVAGQRDLSQGVPYVRDGLFSWIRWLDKQTGVDGYRIDAAKHMPPDFIEGLLWQVQDGMSQRRFAVGEYYDGNPNTLGWYVNATHGRSGVFDFTFFFNLLSMAHGNGYFDMRTLRNRFQDDAHSVTFVNNHDTSGRGNGLHLYMRANLAYAVIMAFPGYPSVYWLDLFDDQGNPRDYLTNLIWIHHMLAKGAAIERWADDDLYVLEREGNLLAGFNDNTNTWRSEWVRTSFGPNVRLHDYAGGIGDLWTNQDGYVRVSVPPSGYVMYGRDNQIGKVPSPPARRTRQEYEGAADMDMHPAHESYSEPTRFTVAANKRVWITAWFEDRQAMAHLELYDAQGHRLHHVRGAGQLYFPYDPTQDGWLQVRTGLEQTGQNKTSRYWLQLDYEGPKLDPGPAPRNTTWDALPLVSTSVGP